MKKLRDVMKNPSGWDSLSNYTGSIPESEWLVVMTRNRDSDILTESNWENAIELLGDESETVQIFRFGHWACGWWEAMCVKEKTESEVIGQKIEDRLSDYPVLNEEHFSEMELEEANRIWESCYNKKERLEYIRKNRNQFDFRNFSDLMQCIRGEYFSGYASELIG